MTVKFASKIEVVLMPVQNDAGKAYQKPYIKVTTFDGDEVYTQLRNDLNIAEFSRYLVAGLDYNTVSVAAEFAPMREQEEQKEEKKPETPSMTDIKQVLNEVMNNQQKAVETKGKK